MGEIENEIESLKSLLNSDLLDEKSKEDIKTTLTMFDSVKEYDLNGGTNKISINYINKSPNKNPEYATSGSAGFDFRAHLQSPIEIPGCNSGDNIRIIPTGLYFELPEGLELQVRPRSGLAAKHGITVLNSPGTVDCVPKGTLISTPSGDIKVEELFESNDKKVIYSMDESEHIITEDVVTDMWIVDNIEMIEIITEENDTLRIPKTKEVYTNMGWVIASKLTKNHKILKIN